MIEEGSGEYKIMAAFGGVAHVTCNTVASVRFVGFVALAVTNTLDSYIHGNKEAYHQRLNSLAMAVR